MHSRLALSKLTLWCLMITMFTAIAEKLSYVIIDYSYAWLYSHNFWTLYPQQCLREPGVRGCMYDCCVHRENNIFGWCKDENSICDWFEGENYGHDCCGCETCIYGSCWTSDFELMPRFWAHLPKSALILKMTSCIVIENNGPPVKAFYMCLAH